MPQQPDAVYAPQVTIDDSKKYVLKLVGLDEQPSKFRDRRKDAMSLVHRFLVYDLETGVAVEDEARGELYEQWYFTNDLTYDNTTSGKIAPARELANALCGKRLTDDEVKQMLKDGWAEALMGKMVVADLEWQTVEGVERLKVLRVKPYRGKEKLEETAPAPAAAASASKASDKELPF
jgi:hypothetical protein